MKLASKIAVVLYATFAIGTVAMAQHSAPRSEVTGRSSGMKYNLEVEEVTEDSVQWKQPQFAAPPTRDSKIARVARTVLKGAWLGNYRVAAPSKSCPFKNLQLKLQHDETALEISADTKSLVVAPNMAGESLYGPSSAQTVSLQKISYRTQSASRDTRDPVTLRIEKRSDGTVSLGLKLSRPAARVECVLKFQAKN